MKITEISLSLSLLCEKKEPPSLQFLCQMYHPNIYRDGKVCITTLQTAKLDDDDAAERDSSAYWRPVLGVEQALLSVVSLLSDPNTDDPANLDAAERYVHVIPFVSYFVCFVLCSVEIGRCLSFHLFLFFFPLPYRRGRTNI